MSALPKLATASDGVHPQDRNFWDDVFISLAPNCMTAYGWKMGDEPVSTTEQRMELCARLADAAVRARNKRF